MTRRKQAKPNSISDPADQAMARRLGERQVVQVPGLPVSEAEAWDRVIALGRRSQAQPSTPAVPVSPSYIINAMIEGTGQSAPSPIPLNGPRVIAAALSGMSVQDGRRE